MCRQICGNICLMHRNAKKSKNGPSRSQNSKMPEDYVVFSVDRYTCRTPHFHMYSHSTDHTTQMTCAQRLREFLRVKTGHSSTRHGSSLLHATMSTSSPSLSSTSLVLLSSSSRNSDLLSTYPILHCEDPRQDGTSTEDQLLHRARAQKDRAQQDAGQTTKSKS